MVGCHDSLLRSTECRFRLQCLKICRDLALSVEEQLSAHVLKDERPKWSVEHVNEGTVRLEHIADPHGEPTKVAVREPLELCVLDLAFAGRRVRPLAITEAIADADWT
jgi:hypothetical protein